MTLFMAAVSARSIEHDPAQLDLGDWFACDYPERPADVTATVYLSDCYPCRLALRAAAMEIVRRYSTASEHERRLVELSIAWGTT